MLFKDCKFKDKKNILNSWKQNVFQEAVKILHEKNIHVRQLVLNNYIECLLEETDYNVRDNVFYEPISRYKFTVEVFAQITVEYVREHLIEFTSLR